MEQEGDARIAERLSNGFAASMIEAMELGDGKTLTDPRTSRRHEYTRSESDKAVAEFARPDS